MKFMFFTRKKTEKMLQKKIYSKRGEQLSCLLQTRWTTELFTPNEVFSFFICLLVEHQSEKWAKVVNKEFYEYFQDTFAFVSVFHR